MTHLIRSPPVKKRNLLLHNFWQEQNLPESLPKAQATHRMFPKASRSFRQLIGYSRKLADIPGKASGLPEMMPETRGSYRVR